MVSAAATWPWDLRGYVFTSVPLSHPAYDSVTQVNDHTAEYLKCYETRKRLKGQIEGWDNSSVNHACLTGEALNSVHNPEEE